MNFPNRRRIALFGGGLCVLVLGFYQATHAQSSSGQGTFSVDMQQVLFSNVPAGGVANQTIHVTATASTMVSINTSNSASWLQISPTGVLNVTAGSPTPVVVTANTAGPPALIPGTYETSFTINTLNNTASPT